MASAKKYSMNLNNRFSLLTETRQLTRSANHLDGFYMIETVDINGLVSYIRYDPAGSLNLKV